MDALSHAVETAVTRRRNPFSQMLSREAFRLCAGAAASLRTSGDLDARGDVLLGAALAGLAIENSMLGAAHAAANPLTARYGVIHGHAVGLMLPAVVRFNAQDPEVAPLYHQLALQGGLIDPRSPNGTRPGKRSPAFFAVISGRPVCRDRFPVSTYPMAILSFWPRTPPSNGRERLTRDP